MSAQKIAHTDFEIALAALNQIILQLQWSEQVLLTTQSVTTQRALRSITQNMLERRQDQRAVTHEIACSHAATRPFVRAQHWLPYPLTDMPMLHAPQVPPNDLDLLDWCICAERALSASVSFALDNRLSADGVRALQTMHLQLLADQHELHALFESTVDSCAQHDVHLSSSSPRVLVVEDDPDLRSLVSEGLESYGFSVELACDGLDALDKAGEQDVILLDLSMPRLDGRHFLQQMRERVHNPPPVVIFSAAIDQQTRHELRVANVVSKTADFEDLVKALRQSAQMSVKQAERRCDQPAERSSDQQA